MSFVRGLGPALCLGLLISFPLIRPAMAAATGLVGYKAAYRLSLARPDIGGSTVGVAGVLTIDFADVCDGYALSQRLAMAVTDASGETRHNEFVISTWESRDGRSLRFNLDNRVNGQEVAHYAGHAEMKSGQAGGHVLYTLPAGKRMALPPGTVFPTEQIRHLIAAARKGETFRADTVFDGSGEDGLTSSGGAIGKPIPPPAAHAGSVLNPLAGVESWPVRIAYFDYDATDSVPQNEVGIRLFADGVASDLVLDYGDFAIQGTLAKLELSPRPDCHRK